MTHALVDGRGLPLVLLLTTGQAGDSPALPVLLSQLRIPRVGAGRPRSTPEVLRGDKAYSAKAHRDLLRTRGVKVVIRRRATRKPTARTGARVVADRLASTLRTTRTATLSNGPLTSSRTGAGSRPATTSSVDLQGRDGLGLNRALAQRLSSDTP